MILVVYFTKLDYIKFNYNKLILKLQWNYI